MLGELRHRRFALGLLGLGLTTTVLLGGGLLAAAIVATAGLILVELDATAGRDPRRRVFMLVAALGFVLAPLACLFWLREGAGAGWALLSLTSTWLAQSVRIGLQVALSDRRARPVACVAGAAVAVAAAGIVQTRYGLELELIACSALGLAAHVAGELGFGLLRHMLDVLMAGPRLGREARPRPRPTSGTVIAQLAAALFAIPVVAAGYLLSG